MIEPILGNGFVTYPFKNFSVALFITEPSSTRFVCFQVRRLCTDGVKIGNSRTSYLGHPEMGEIFAHFLNFGQCLNVVLITKVKLRHALLSL